MQCFLHKEAISIFAQKWDIRDLYSVRIYVARATIFGPTPILANSILMQNIMSNQLYCLVVRDEARFSYLIQFIGANYVCSTISYKKMADCLAVRTTEYRVKAA